MARRGEFDPRSLITEPLNLTHTADALGASALKHQTVLHRQRVGSTRKRLARAIAGGADKREIERLQSTLAAREARLDQVKVQFEAANIAAPPASPELAQVLGQVVGDIGEKPYTAALLGGNGELLAATGVEETGGFVLSLNGSIKMAWLQISDVNQTVLYRDAKAFGVEIGKIATRRVQLTVPKRPPTPPPAVLTMPELVGQTEAAGCAILFRLGVRDIDLSNKPGALPPGLVIAQVPQAGEVLDPAQGARLVISGKPDSENDDDTQPLPVTMPEFVGQPIANVRREAKRLKIKLTEIARQSGAPRDQVIAQTPGAGTELAAPLRATVVISSGLAGIDTVEVPDLVGRKEREATAIVQETGLVLARQTIRVEGEAGIVVDQQPRAGTGVVPGTQVLITVNLGPVPDEPVRGDVNFSRKFLAAIAEDARLERLGIDRRRLATLASDLELDSAGQVKALIELDNAALSEKAGLANLNQARTLRSILRGALERIG